MRKYLTLSQKVSLLINGNKGIISILLIVVGLLVSLLIMRNSEFSTALYLRKDTLLGKGKITDVFETNTSVNEEYVYGYEYIFYSPIGDLYGISYQRGYVYELGSEVEIVYNKFRPDYNKIKGMSTNPGGMLLIISFAIPVFIGLVWLIINFIIGASRLKIIQNGKVTKGILIDKITTNSKINDNTVYKLVFKYKANNREYQVTTRTHKPEKLEDESEKLLIYNSWDASKALLVDSLPWGVPKFIKDNWRK